MPNANISIGELQSQFPYQFQQWPIERGAGPLQLRPGWHALFARLCEDVHEVLSPAQRRVFRWLAVKERFGAMRSYFAGELNPAVSQLVKQAEQHSTRICELCGQAGALRRFDGSWATRCSYHAVVFAARILLVREQRLAGALEPRINRQLAQWMQTPDPRWDGQSPQILCATLRGAEVLLELLLLQLQPAPRMH